MATIQQFENSHYEKLYLGINSYIDAIKEVLKTSNASKIFLITTTSLKKSEHFLTLKQTLDPYLVAIFTEAKAHNPQSVIKNATNAIKENSDIDLIISFGGGSVVDLAKAVAYEINQINSPAIIALPTTLSGAEFTSGAAVSDSNGVKHLINSIQLAPKWIILDPLLNLDTPSWLWSSTGLKTVADCIETVCSKYSNPMTDQFAFSGLKLFHENLANSCKDPLNIQARQELLIATAISLPAGRSSWLGAIAGFRHQLGAQFHVPHGVASTIILPHILRWNFKACIKQYAKLASIVSCSISNKSEATQAECFIDYVDSLINEIGIQKKLRDLIDDKNSLKKMILPILESPCTKANPRALTKESDVYKILEAAW